MKDKFVFLIKMYIIRDIFKYLAASKFVNIFYLNDQYHFCTLKVF